MPIKKQWLSWEEFEKIQGGDWTPGAHTHLKADITDTPWAWADVSKVGSNLTDLATRQHAGLTDVTSDQHHAKLHSDEHQVGGSDLINHDSLTGFVAAEHKSLPNTITEVLSDHTKAVHDALDIDAMYIDGQEVSAPSPLNNEVLTYETATSKWKAKAAQEGTDELVKVGSAGTPGYLDSTYFLYDAAGIHLKESPTVHPISVYDADTVDNEHASAIVTDARVKAHFPDTIANVLSNHTKAIHDALDIDARYIDGEEVSAPSPTDGYVLTWEEATLKWKAKAPQAGTDELVKVGAAGTPQWLNPDFFLYDAVEGIQVKPNYLLTDVDVDKVDGKHIPNTIANVLSDHTKTVHDSLALDHGALSGRGDDDHSIYYNAARHTKAVHDALLITVLGSGALAKDHLTAATDMLVNVCYGTGNPPTANTTTEGTLFVKYTA